MLDDITSVGPTPTSNDTYRHTFTVSADASGEVLLEAREAGSQTGALINGLQLDLAPPPIVSTWDIDGSGSWQASASWDNSLVPAAQNQQAVFGSKISSPEVVVLESAVSVNRVEFNNSQKYAIFGPSQHSVNLVTDTLSNTPTLQVVQGGHQFQAAVNLQDNTGLDVAAGGSLAFDQALNLNGNTLTKTGSGTALVNNSLNTGGGSVIVNGGTLGGAGEVGGSLTANVGTTIAPGTSFGTLTVETNYTQNPGSTLLIELGGTDKGQTYDVLDVTGTLNAGGTLQVVLDSFSPAGGNQFDILDFGGITGSFALNLPGGVSWDTSQLLTTGILSVMGGQTGDFEGDSDVDGVDFLKWQRGESPSPLSASDLADWQANYGATLLSASAASVPEPATSGLLLMAVAALTIFGSRRSWTRLPVVAGMLLLVCVGTNSTAMAQTFTSVATTNAQAWADYNNDGFPDLFGRKAMWRNNRDGTFTEFDPFEKFDQASGARSLGDFNNDGRIDVLAYIPILNDPGMTGDRGPQLYLNNADLQYAGTGWVRQTTPGSNIFGALDGGTGLFPTTGAEVNRDVSWADLNGDGYLDVYVSAFSQDQALASTDQDIIYTSNAGSSFTHTWASPVSRYGRGITTVDYDQDGDQDVAVANYFGQNNFLWQNTNFNGSTGLSDVAIAEGIPGGDISIGATAADLNNDGAIDLIFTNLDHPPNPAEIDPLSTINWNNGSPNYDFTSQTFTQVGIPAAVYGGAIPGDFDNDGYEDLFLTIASGSGGSDEPKLYKNDGDGTFTDVTATYGLSGMGAGNSASDDAAWADFNGDGYLDLMADQQVWLNPASGYATDGHYLKIKLIGGQGPNGLVNKAALGAQVRVVDGTAGTITRHVTGGQGQGSQSDQVIHLGLGDRTAPVDLEIFWPDGSTQNVLGVAVNQLVQINIDPVEPDPLSVVSGFKWSDENNDATWDVGEPGLNGWTVYLDANADNVLNNPVSGDGICDGNATEACSITANDGVNDGAYSFTGLTAGSYTLREVPQGNASQTYPAPVPPGEHSFTLLPGQNMPGFFEITHPANFGGLFSTVIDGFKWNDRDNDGVWDADEPGLNGVTVYVDDNNDDVLNNPISGDGVCDANATESCSITANNGSNDGAFSLVDLTAGTHTIREVLSGGLLQSFPVAPGEHSVTLASGEISSGTFGVAGANNFGNVDSNDPVRVWNVDAFGAFGENSNWTFAGAPNSNDHTAVFGSVISTTRPIFLESDITLGGIILDNNQTYALGGLGEINLAADSLLNDPTVDVLQGSHEIQTLLNLLADTTIDIATGAVLSLNGALDLNGFTLTMTGGGTLLINNHITTDGGSIILPLVGAIGGDGYAAYAVPEPASAALLATVSLVTLFVRRRDLGGR